MATAWDAFPVSATTSYANFCTSPQKRTLLSPTSSSYDRSSVLSARLQPQPTKTPFLPLEIIRRIISAALSLPPSVPLPATGNPTPEWDEFAGRAGKRLLASRVATRTEVTRTARNLMAVCKTWKPLVLKYLYAEPAVTGDNVTGLAHAVVQGDRKWSDINLHPHSSPGRWITVLDLSSLSSGSYLGADSLTIARALAALLDLAPGLTHLRLPPSGVRLVDLREAPCVRTLKAIEGLHLGPGSSSEEDAVHFLRATRNLEVLGLVWVGSSDILEDMEFDDEEEAPLPPTLGKLHTLMLVASRPGPLLSALTRAELPQLSRLVMSPYDQNLDVWEDDTSRGGSRALQRWHGSKIRSLTYVSTPGWPPDSTLPPNDTLSLHPNLVHLHLALPHALLHDNPNLALTLADKHHPLSSLTIPRWPRVIRNPSVSPHGTNEEYNWPPGNRFLSALAGKPSRLRVISIDGFNWVQPALGYFAAQSGDSGMMRTWATWLAKCGMEFRDMDGAVAPVIERGRPGPPWGRKSVDGGRRMSIEQGGRMNIEQGRRMSIEQGRRYTGDSDGG